MGMLVMAYSSLNTTSNSSRSTFSKSRCNWAWGAGKKAPEGL